MQLTNLLKESPLHLAIFASPGRWPGSRYLSTRIMETTLAALGDPRSKIRERSHVPAIEGIREPMRKMEDWARGNGYEEDVMFDFWTMSEEKRKCAPATLGGSGKPSPF